MSTLVAVAEKRLETRISGYIRMMERQTGTELRRGWTTGACATGAAKAAFSALLTGSFPDPVDVSLPKGGITHFALAFHDLSKGIASAAIIKDAGDDPDVTHGAVVRASVRLTEEKTGVTFKAGPGVGTVTKPGLPIPPGEPAINPVPRQMIRDALTQVAQENGLSPHAEVTLSIDDGEALALKTMNPRLGILGGLSVLGTTGIVRPFSCAAWIASIHRGIDVARASGLTHVVGATGSTSEDAVRARYALDEAAYLDMGDFAGGVLKYLREHPVPKLTLAGGFAKFTKLAQGALDLHSARSQVDLSFLQGMLKELNAPLDLQEACLQANTAKEVLDLAQATGLDLGTKLAAAARTEALNLLRGSPIQVEVLITDRSGRIVGEAGFDENS